MLPPELALPITVDEILWVEKEMGLKRGAFDTERIHALKHMNSTDIQACPGSGKTTLLVAKLAILGNRWESSTRGICVLSHTNVARKEIENRLGKNGVAKKILSYPHYVGTIHGFVNEFIAMPWVRSLGYPIRVIDREMTLRRRWAQLPVWVKESRQISSYKEKSLESSGWAGLPPRIRSGRGFLGNETNIISQLRSTIQNSFFEGYFTFDELFLFANDALNNMDGLVSAVKRRFPVIFIDEAQDCSEIQNIIISKIFPSNSLDIVRQRFGDGNQAIYASIKGDGAQTDSFPASTNLTISKSIRLHQSIATLADPLGISPYSMIGVGGVSDSKQHHTIILYSNETIKNVLACFGEKILDAFSDEQIEFNDCYAVGQVHNPKHDNPIGAHVGHYWLEYSSQSGKSSENYDTIVEYVNSALLQIAQKSEMHVGVNIIAKGILNFLRNSCNLSMPASNSNFRALKKAIMEKGADSSLLDDWLLSALKLSSLDKSLWNAELLPSLLETLGRAFSISIAANNPFWLWPHDENGTQAATNQTMKPLNVFKHVSGPRKVDIKLGSIHSVKGQTHLATLVLDTFWKGNKGKTNLTYLLNWISNSKQGKGKEGVENITRLKCHYVAMTRPTDLLCLAIHKENIDDKMIEKLTAAGWFVELS